MSEPKVTLTVGGRVKVITSKTLTRQWITGKVTHTGNNKVFIQYDSEWNNVIRGHPYEWINTNDNKQLIKFLNQKSVKTYCMLTTCNSDSYLSLSNKVTIPTLLQ